MAGQIIVDNIAIAADFINQGEKDAAPANDNGRVVKLESVSSEDAKIHQDFLPKAIVQGMHETLRLMSPVTDDEATLFSPKQSISLTQINALIQGSSSPFIYLSIYKGSDRSSGTLAGILNIQSLTTVDSKTFAALNALDLESGSTQYASITDASQTGLNLSGDFTLEAECIFESLAANQVLLGKTDLATQAQRGYHVEITTGGQVDLWVSDGTTTTILNSTAGVIAVGVPVHIAVKYDVSAGQAFFFINGIAKGNPTGGVTVLNAPAEPFAIGVRFNTTAQLPLDAKIREVRVWNTLRTDSEITDNAFMELVGNETNLQGLWRFNDVYTDLTANSNDLTATGAPVFGVWFDDVDIAADDLVWAHIITEDGTVDELMATLFFATA